MASRISELSLADYLHGSDARRAEFSAALLGGLKNHGFVVLREHTVPEQWLDEAYQVSAAFFSQPEQDKRRYAGGARGYTPFRTEHAKDHLIPDLKEFWQIGPERDAPVDHRNPVTEPPNIWPAVPSGFRAVCSRLHAALESAGRMVLEALTPGLGVARDYFAERVNHGNSVLRLLHYPPIPADADRNAVRSAPHEDINLLTLLPAPQGPGLELLDRDGSWLPVITARNNLIVDSGDMLARMTNDVIPATTHRVVNPDANVSRYSMPFFMHPNSGTVLSCLPSCVGGGARYPDILADELLERRLRDIGLVGGAKRARSATGDLA